MSRHQTFTLTFALMLLFTFHAVVAGGTQTESQLEKAPAITAFDAQAVEKMRALGPAGLEQVMQEHGPTLRQLLAAQASGDIDAASLRQLQELKTYVDQVAGQYDAHTSGLFWFTNLYSAKDYASKHNKPILTLSLLGKLTDEYSCANSRFFRTILYADPTVSKYLRENFVLHWNSVRPVPIVTVDFGDGRVLKRTVTGNSIHFVIHHSGVVLDALPGLMAPEPWLAHVQTAAALGKDLNPKLDGTWRSKIATHHKQRLAELSAQWDEYVKEAGMPADPKALDEGQWHALASRHPENSRLSDEAINNVRRGAAIPAERAMELAMSKRAVEDPVMRMVQNLTRNVATDTLRNEHLLHRELHEWLATHPDISHNSMTFRVYDKLFLTPSSDPWLGLATTNFAALEDNGMTVPKREDR